MVDVPLMPPSDLGSAPSPEADPYHLLRETIATMPPGAKVRVPKDRLPLAPYPTWRRSVGYPLRGAVRQFRDGCVHVHETPSEWVVHRDLHNPHEAFIKHLYHDCRKAFWVYSAVSSTMAALAARAVYNQVTRPRSRGLVKIASSALQGKRPPTRLGRLFS